MRTRILIFTGGCDGKPEAVLNVPEEFNTKEEYDRWYAMKHQTNDPNFDPNLPEFVDYIKTKYFIREAKEVEIF